MDDKDKIELLKSEYLKVQDFYEDFDKRILSIKGWAITICLGATGIGFEKEIAILSFFSIGAALMFWWIEAKWKTFQYSHGHRIEHLESFFRGEIPLSDVHPMQIYDSFFNAYTGRKGGEAEGRKTLTYARYNLVQTPYLYIILLDIGLLVYMYVKPCLG